MPIGIPRQGPETMQVGIRQPLARRFDQKITASGHRLIKQSEIGRSGSACLADAIECPDTHCHNCNQQKVVTHFSSPMPEGRLEKKEASEPQA